MTLDPDGAGSRSAALQSCPVLMTSCVRAGDVPILAMTDSQERLLWTLCGLMMWLREPCVKHLVLCDNSGFPLDRMGLEAIAESSGKVLEVLVFDDNRLAQKYGKGAGEGEIILHALAHSCVLQSAEAFWKITAKMFVVDFGRVCFWHSGADVVFQYPGWTHDSVDEGVSPWALSGVLSRVRRRARRAARRVVRGFDADVNVNTRFFKTSREYFSRVLSDAHLRVRDDRRYFLEHEYARRLLSNGFERFVEAPRLMGRSGSLGGVLDLDFPADVQSAARRLSERFFRS